MKTIDEWWEVFEAFYVSTDLSVETLEVTFKKVLSEAMADALERDRERIIEALNYERVVNANNIHIVNLETALKVVRGKK